MNRNLFDTNMLLLLLRQDARWDTLQAEHHFDESFNFISVVSLGMTSRNMGKNDLWIAATASVLHLKFFTTDRDFDHLAHDFIDLERIDLLAIGK